MKSSSNRSPDPQPNVFGDENATAFSSGFWVLVVLTGIGAGLGGAALMGLLRLTQHLAWSYQSGDFLDAVSKTTSGHRFGVLLLAGVLVALAGFCLKRPAGGHGGEVSAAIWFRSGELPVGRTLAKAVLSMIVVGLGTALGREGAPKQVGAVLGGVLAKWAQISSAQRRLLTACGAGAGLAAVYNVPLGGALFTMEILLGTISLSLALPALTTSCLAVAVSWLFLPNRTVYSFPDYPFSPGTLLGAGFLGVFAGLASAFYLKWMAWADGRKPKGKWRIIAPILVFTALGLAACIYPQLLGNGKNVVQLTFFNQLGTPLLAALFFLRPLASGACLACGAPGGLFTPTLTFGALLGALFGHAWNILFPGEPTAVYAFLGAGAVFGAGMKAPFSAMVLLFELTNHVAPLVLPLILVIAIATGVAARLDPRSIYSARIHLGKAAARRRREGLPPGVVFDESQVISSAVPFAEVLKKWLKLAGHRHRLYVLDEEGEFVGEIGATDVIHAERFSSPLETTSADDLATPAKSLSSSLSAAEMERQLEVNRALQLPVTEAASKRFLGLFRGSGSAGRSDPSN